MLQRRPGYGANLQVKPIIDLNKLYVWVYYYLQFMETSKYVWKDKFMGMIKERFGHKGESIWRRWKGCQNSIHDILCEIKWLRIADMAMVE